MMTPVASVFRIQHGAQAGVRTRGHGFEPGPEKGRPGFAQEPAGGVGAGLDPDDGGGIPEKGNELLKRVGRQFVQDMAEQHGLVRCVWTRKICGD